MEACQILGTLKTKKNINKIIETHQKNTTHQKKKENLFQLILHKQNNQSVQFNCKFYYIKLSRRRFALNQLAAA